MNLAKAILLSVLGIALAAYAIDCGADMSPEQANAVTEGPLAFAKRIGVRYSLAVATDDLKQKFGGIEGLPTTMLYV